MSCAIGDAAVWEPVEVRFSRPFCCSGYRWRSQEVSYNGVQDYSRAMDWSIFLVNEIDLVQSISADVHYFVSTFVSSVLPTVLINFLNAWKFILIEAKFKLHVHISIARIISLETFHVRTALHVIVIDFNFIVYSV